MTRRTLARQNIDGSWSVASGPDTGVNIGGFPTALAYAQGTAGITSHDLGDQPTESDHLSDEGLIALGLAAIEAPEPEPTE